jgi:hypothetical protein
MEKLNPNIPKMGYIWLYANTGDLFGNLIERTQRKNGYGDWSKWVHAEISLGGWNSVNTMPPKTQPIDIRIDHPHREALLFRLDYPDYETRKRYKIATWAVENLVGKHYDWWGIARFKIPWLFHEKDAYFCSEGCVNDIQREHPNYLGAAKPENISPAGMIANKQGIKLPEIIPVWYGTIPTITEGLAYD